MARMLFHCKHGADDPERAIVPFIAANVAAASGQEAVVLLTIDGAWLCRRGYAERMVCDADNSGEPPGRIGGHSRRQCRTVHGAGDGGPEGSSWRSATRGNLFHQHRPDQPGGSALRKHRR